MKQKLMAFMRGFCALIAAVAEDILILCGLGVITYATFQLCSIAGWYCLGACLFGLGAWITAHPKRR